MYLLPLKLISSVKRFKAARQLAPYSNAPHPVNKVQASLRARFANFLLHDLRWAMDFLTAESQRQALDEYLKKTQHVLKGGVHD